MAYTSEIEKLERRYAENPQGRNFAPLADAYRKAGQVDQAVELLKGGLERHPDYVSAHIVLGRCLLDQKNDPGAEEVFRGVLSLDPENVIAFRVLSDIADRGHRYDESVDWLTRLLAADPMNGDAAEALSVAKGKAAAQAPPASQRSPAAPPPTLETVAIPPSPIEPAPLLEPEPGLIETFHSPAAEPPIVEQLTEPAATVSEQATPPEPAAGEVGGDLETFDGTMDFKSLGNDAAAAQGIELQEEVVIKPTPIAIEGLARTQYEGSGLFKLDQSQPAAEEPAEEELPTVDLPLILPEDSAPPPQRRPSPMPAMETPLPPPPLPPSPPPPPPPPVARAAEPAAVVRPRRPASQEPPVAAAVTLSDDDGAADTVALSKVEPLVTETMAELLLKQGHEEDARRVYEALLAQRPGDARLRARVDELRNRGRRVETVRVFLKNILSGRTVTTRPASDDRSPIDAAFAQVHESDIPGAPTHAATDSISLDEVFGEGTAEPMTSSGEDQPAAIAPAPSPPAGASGGFSFDEFFGGKSGPGGNAPAPTPPGGMPDAAPPTPSKPGNRPSGSRGKLPLEEESDLDQFQAWLKGLKA